MPHYRFLLLIIGLFLLVKTSNAQKIEKSCFICKSGEVHHTHESPYANFTLKKEALIVGGAFGAAASTLLIKSPEPLSVDEINLLDGQAINRFDRYAISKQSKSAKRASDILLTGVLVLPTLFLSNHYTRKDVLPLIAMSVETVLINLTITNITKKLVKRTRPLAYNPNFPLSEKTTENARVSFFSGHTSHTASLSFLVAKVMTDYHPHAKSGIKIGIWSFAAAIPAVTGYLRVRAGKHFPTDTITGFIAGGLVGILVPHFHRPRKNLKNKKVILTPSVGVGMAALQLRF